MPYIKPDERENLENAMGMTTNPGELNYAITCLCDDYLVRKGLRYEHINAVIGALECAKLEMYSRVASVYEAKKERENGDVYSDASPSIHNIAWAGGFFEGEGCFYAHYHKPRQDGSKVFRTQASMNQKGEQGKLLLEQFQRTVRCGVVYPDGDMFVWKTTKNGEAKQVFEILRPYLGERRQQSFLDLDARENNQVFNPPKPPRTHCKEGHDLDEVGRRKDGTCAECDRAYKRNWYHENKETTS